jgi:hypothetical protein
MTRSIGLPAEGGQSCPCALEFVGALHAVPALSIAGEMNAR